MPKLIFARHGKSEWNKANKFTGWVDVDLAPEGIEEAKDAGQKLKEAGIEFDIAYTSVLTRAIKTCHYILEETDQLWVPEVKSWRLNERHYGALQGLDKQNTRDKYGDEQVHIWRRSYDVLPPLTDPEPDRRYADLDPSTIPGGENLKVTLERALPFWEDHIAPDLRAGKTVLVAAHGNSLRALAKHIEGISDDDIMDLEIPTGKPSVYELNDDLSVKDKYYL
ncbi:2,3-diphosphoglycerate-dependent phosphoglycerate mutase [Tetragenococcus osmophilus]|uniref:2,3-bisphosphoglycerate-dependent phosphoglycerate mutase n=1 Tax=Tetragenococcus osmophilus TaxID=526944 RepID=A0AA37XM11_9ENTE|nr:2,3-diphosphoglycerate-dependent phosphoglycerate mutase [Tetragenococcus osmophilus]AYW47862.1 2,3-diphosphoglycerate-dependent phosphoglycerate mutase [Tetragenococcus osmophilus]GMA53564.1 2,3-bisphosphoglycerate-dependent phosphoglycerate mutase [Alicyclobacillus contaminans]GMA72495.1 2,3-bisphosphoglycerate-dependent phosphoglycerate mutase [Tetragenococcus osmophilus]